MSRKNRRKKVTGTILSLLLLGAAALARAQTAAELENLLNAKEIAWAEAAYFALAAQADAAPAASRQDAFQFALEQGWLPKNAQADGKAAPLAAGFPARTSCTCWASCFRIPGTERGMTVNMKRSSYPLAVFLAALLLSAAPLRAQDFGLIFRQKPVITNREGSNSDLAYTGTVIPWFSAPLGEKTDLYFSGGISAELENDLWRPLPELYRFEFIYNPNPDARLELGRVPFKESASYVFSGLFDGAAARFNIGGGRLSAGAFYTGLLNKKAVYIVMSEDDKQGYYNRDVYFSSRRLVLGINWEKTGIFDTRNTVALSGLGQFDLNAGNTKLHTQYLAGRFNAPFGHGFSAEAGGVFELIEQGQDAATAFALSLDLFWLPPSTWRDSLTLGGRFSSGSWSDTSGTFLPITTQAQGKVLRPGLSGIALVQGSYTARLHAAFSADLSAAYFVRTDETSYSDREREASTRSPLLGGGRSTAA
jgi:hypothetical protein